MQSNAEQVSEPDKQLHLNLQATCSYKTCVSCGVLTLLQFNRFDPQDGRITERDFARMILSYADINTQQKKKYRKRVKKAYEDDNQVRGQGGWR